MARTGQLEHFESGKLYKVLFVCLEKLVVVVTDFIAQNEWTSLVIHRADALVIQAPNKRRNDRTLSTSVDKTHFRYFISSKWTSPLREF